MQLDLYTSGVPSLIQQFFRRPRSIIDAKCTFTPLFLGLLITSNVFLTFARLHAERFSSFSNYLSAAALAAGIFVAWGIGLNLWTKLKWCSELLLFPCKMVVMNLRCNSFHTHIPSFLASVIHGNLDLWSSFLLRVEPCQLYVFLHGIASAAGISNFFRAFMMISLNSISSGSI